MRSGLITAGEEAPDFAMPAADNSVWTRSELLRGRKALLVFYRRSSPAARLVLMSVERMFRRLSRAGLRVVGVAQDSHPDTLELADAFQITFPLLLDRPPFALTAAYGVESVPTQVVLEPGGTVAETLVSFSRGEQELLFRRLAAALGSAESVLFTPDDLIPERQEGEAISFGARMPEDGK